MVAIKKKKLDSGEPFYDEEERNRAIVVPDSFIGPVRDSIFGMYAAKQHVTVDTVLQTLRDEYITRASSWKWSRSTHYRFRTEKMHYSYSKHHTTRT